MHIPHLVIDLALILTIAGFVTLVFRWIKQPLVLGYLLTGILLGPQITLFPTVVEVESVKVWAELGVIFLLFVLGLEFSFKKLREVGKTATIAAAFEVVVMTFLGYAAGWLLGWNLMDSLFLGGILAISSTTIIVKAFDEQGVKTQLFAGLVFGILVIEDLFAILLLAILSSIGATKSLEGVALLKQVGLLGAFLLIVIPLGLWLTPRFFKLIRSQLNDETRVIVSLALCLGLVALSTYAGFSSALGAFLMGAFMGETSEGERVERFLKPIRDLFGAVFFTSVGMLVDIHSIMSHLPLVIFISVVTIVGKIFSTMAGALMAGQDRKTSFQTGLCLAQIGEFSFIIATLGLSLNVIRPELYPLAVAVALISTFSTPYLVKWASHLRVPTIRQGKKKSKAAKPRLWDGHLVEFEIHPNFSHVGKSLQELKLRDRFGVSLVSLIRGDQKLLAPSRDDRIMPFDRITILGTDSQLAEVEKFLGEERHDFGASYEVKFGLENIVVKAGDFLVGKNLRNSGIRESSRGIVLGIERKGEKILNPDSAMLIDAGDVLWVYGQRERLKHMVLGNEENA